MNTLAISSGASKETENRITKRPQGNNFAQIFNETQRLELEKKKLWKAAQDLEAMFAYQMIKEMRKTIPRKDNPLYGGHAEEIFQEMLDHKYSELISGSSTLGLAAQIYNQMAKYVK
ncbi:TPA: hypothetical protein DCX15_01825 [bacterium]|nr:hypothetical protein [bacterium]